LLQFDWPTSFDETKPEKCREATKLASSLQKNVQQNWMFSLVKSAYKELLKNN